MTEEGGEGGFKVEDVLELIRWPLRWLPLWFPKIRKSRNRQELEAELRKETLRLHARVSALEALLIAEYGGTGDEKRVKGTLRLLERVIEDSKSRPLPSSAETEAAARRFGRSTEEAREFHQAYFAAYDGEFIAIQKNLEGILIHRDEKTVLHAIDQLGPRGNLDITRLQESLEPTDMGELEPMVIRLVETGLVEADLRRVGAFEGAIKKLGFIQGLTEAGRQRLRPG